MDMKNIAKLIGINDSGLNQILMLSSYLSELPQEKQQVIVGDFVQAIKEAVEEQRGEK